MSDEARTVRRPPLWLCWLLLGVGIYYLVPVVVDWSRRDWQETEIQNVSELRGMNFGLQSNALGQMGPRLIGFESSFQYRYRVAGVDYSGVWEISDQELVFPVRVLYDPADPYRSILAPVPPSPVSGWVGWSCMALALTGFAGRRVSSPWPVPEVSVAELPGPWERNLFRALVGVGLVLWMVRRSGEFAVDRVSLELYEAIDRELPASDLERFFLDSSTLLDGLTVLVALGLVMFWRPARLLNVVLWGCWLAWTALGAATLDYGVYGLLTMLGRLLGGAVIALSYHGALGKAFEAPMGAMANNEDEPATEEG